MNINQMEDLRDNFTVMERGDSYVVTVNDERELNLIYEKRTILTSKSLTLKK